MVLQRFLKPKWQHRNPEVRKRAILDLPADATPVLGQIAQHDPDSDLRQIAVRRLRDLELLQRLAGPAEPAAVSAAALQRLQQLLCGERDDAPALTERLAFIGACPATSLIEHVALNARDTALRACALSRVSRPSVLAEAALCDADPANRQAALERIDQRSALERVAKESRRQDKQLHRAAQARLEAVTAAAERPQRARQEGERLRGVLETLGHGARWEQDQRRLAEVEAQWQALQGDLEDGELSARFEQARGAAAERCASRAETERGWAPVRAGLQELVAAMHSLREEVVQCSEADAERDSVFTGRLDALLERWRDAPRLTDAEQQGYRAELEAGRDSVRDHLAHLAEHARALAHWTGLCEQAEALLARASSPTAAELDELAGLWQNRPRPARPDPQRLGWLEQRYTRARAALADQMQRRNAEREALLKTLPGDIERLEAAVAQGATEEALQLEGTVQRTLERMQQLGVPPRHLGRDRARLHALHTRLREMQSWKNWGVNRARERLCEHMEALAGSDVDPVTLAERIRETQAQWKELERNGATSPQQLWERFQCASHKAYAPCQQHFEQQAARQQEHVKQREAICERLERLHAETDWNVADWKAVLAQLRDARKDWHQAGGVHRKQRKRIEARFMAALESVETHLAQERESCLLRRQKLIEAAVALLESEDPAAAAHECKSLSAQWRVTVPARRREEQALWEQFQFALNAVHARNQARREARDRDTLAQLQRMDQLCAELEALCEKTDEPVPAQRELHRIIGAWGEVQPLPGPRAAGLGARFAAAQQRFEERLHTLEHDAERQALARLRDKARLCEQAEDLGLAGQDPQAIEADWLAAGTLADAVLDQRLEERFARAREAFRKPDELQPAQWEENCSRKRALCLQMEWLAGIDSPTEEAEERMRYQVQRLSEAMQNGRSDPVAEGRELELAWYLIGPVASTQRQHLNVRFERAAQAFHTRFGGRID